MGYVSFQLLLSLPTGSNLKLEGATIVDAMTTMVRRYWQLCIMGVITILTD